MSTWKEFENVVASAKKIEITLQGTMGEEPVETHFKRGPLLDGNRVAFYTPGYHRVAHDARAALAAIKEAYEKASWDWHSLKVKATESPVKGKALKELVLTAWQEKLGAPKKQARPAAGDALVAEIDATLKKVQKDFDAGRPVHMEIVKRAMAKAKKLPEVLDADFAERFFRTFVQEGDVTRIRPEHFHYWLRAAEKDYASTLGSVQGHIDFCVGDDPKALLKQDDYPLFVKKWRAYDQIAALPHRPTERSMARMAKLAADPDVFEAVVDSCESVGDDFSLELAVVLAASMSERAREILEHMVEVVRECSGDDHERLAEIMAKSPSPAIRAMAETVNAEAMDRGEELASVKLMRSLAKKPVPAEDLLRKSSLWIGLRATGGETWSSPFTLWLEMVPGSDDHGSEEQHCDWAIQIEDRRREQEEGTYKRAAFTAHEGWDEPEGWTKGLSQVTQPTDLLKLMKECPEVFGITWRDDIEFRQRKSGVSKKQVLEWLGPLG